MKHLMAATALSLITFACPVYAQSQVELTLEQYIAMANADSAGSIAFSGKDSGADYVEYKDVKIAAPDGSLTIDAAWLRATEKDGMVVLTFAPTVNVSITANGAAGPTSFVVSSENLALTTNVIVADPTTLTSIHVDLAMDKLKVGDLSGDTSVVKSVLFEQTGGSIVFDYDMAANTASGGWTAPALALAYDFAIEGSSQKVSSTSTDIDLAFDMDIPTDGEDGSAYFTGEKSAKVTMSSGASQSSGSMVDRAFSMDYTANGGPSQMEMSITEGDVLLDVTGSDVVYQITPVGMPVPPVDLSMKETTMHIAVPFSATDAPGESQFKIKFADLVIGESAWALVDPGQTIPRDPLNIDVDLGLLAQFSETFVTDVNTNPMAAAKLSEFVVKTFLISAAGAEVTATGGATFDPNSPMPMPTGIISVGAKGVTGLAQKLADLGLLPPDQVGMLGAMMGMYGKSVGDDSYTSDIEFKDGGVTVNGQPMPM